MNTKKTESAIEKKIDIFRNAGRFLPDDFEEMLKSTRTDYTERLKRLGIIK